MKPMTMLFEHQAAALMKKFYEYADVIRATPVNIPAIERARAALVEARAPMLEVKLALAATLPPLDPEMPPSADEQDRRSRVLADLTCLESGNWTAGIFDARLLSPFEGGPGIDALDALIRHADEVIAAEQAKQAVQWPAACRYVGLPGTHTHNGRKLRRGDIVNLTREQFEHWADKFQPVVESEGEAVTS